MPEPYDRKLIYLQAAAGLGLVAEQVEAANQAGLLAEAVDCLRAAIKHGYRDTAYLTKDPDLSFLRTSSEFSSLMNAITSSQ